MDSDNYIHLSRHRFLRFPCVSVNMLADQTISGTAINMFATAFSIYMARTVVGIQQDIFCIWGSFMFDKIPVLGDIPILGPMLFQKSYITTYLGLAILVISAFVLYKTSFGLETALSRISSN